MIDFATADLPTRASIEDRVVTLLAGRSAERVVLGAECVGAGGDTSDLAAATRDVCSIHADWGLGGAATYLAPRGEAVETLSFDYALRARVQIGEGAALTRCPQDFRGSRLYDRRSSDPPGTPSRRAVRRGSLVDVQFFKDSSESISLSRLRCEDSASGGDPTEGQFFKDSEILEPARQVSSRADLLTASCSSTGPNRPDPRLVSGDRAPVPRDRPSPACRENLRSDDHSTKRRPAGTDRLRWGRAI